MITIGTLVGAALLFSLTIRKGLGIISRLAVAILWDLVGTAQTLSLFCIINLGLMPVCLTDFVRAFKPLLLSVMPNLISYMVPASITHSGYPDSKLTDNLGFHPNIFSTLDEQFHTTRCCLIAPTPG